MSTTLSRRRYLAETLLACLGNLAPHAERLHPYAAQRTVAVATMSLRKLKASARFDRGNNAQKYLHSAFYFIPTHVRLNNIFSVLGSILPFACSHGRRDQISTCPFHVPLRLEVTPTPPHHTTPCVFFAPCPVPRGCVRGGVPQGPRPPPARRCRKLPRGHRRRRGRRTAPLARLRSAAAPQGPVFIVVVVVVVIIVGLGADGGYGGGSESDPGLRISAALVLKSSQRLGGSGGNGSGHGGGARGRAWGRGARVRDAPTTARNNNDTHAHTHTRDLLTILFL